MKAIIRSLRKGMQQTRATLPVVATLYLVSVLFAAAMGVLFLLVLSRAFGSSNGSAPLLSGFDYTVYRDVLRYHRNEFSSVLQSVLITGLLYLFFSICTTGGILSHLSNPVERFSPAVFFAGCGKYFFRFLWLFVLLTAACIVYAIIVVLAIMVYFTFLTKDVTSEVTMMNWIIGTAVLCSIPVLFLFMIADYTKILCVRSDEPSVFVSLKRAIRFVFNHTAATTALFLILLLFLLIAVLAYLFLDMSVGMSSPITIAGIFLLQQLFILIRLWIRVLIFESERTLFAELETL